MSLRHLLHNLIINYWICKGPGILFPQALPKLNIDRKEKIKREPYSENANKENILTEESISLNEESESSLFTQGATLRQHKRKEKKLHKLETLNTIEISEIVEEVDKPDLKEKTRAIKIKQKKRWT